MVFRYSTFFCPFQESKSILVREHSSKFKLRFNVKFISADHAVTFWMFWIVFFDWYLIKSNMARIYYFVLRIFFLFLSLLKVHSCKVQCLDTSTKKLERYLTNWSNLHEYIVANCLIFAIWLYFMKKPLNLRNLHVMSLEFKKPLST